MKTHIGKTLGFFTAILLFTGSLPASAIPKAAEHENAPVTIGADVEKPRVSTKQAAKAPTAAEKKPANTKNRSAAKPAKANKTSREKNRMR
jgi:hypothetical protein